MTGEPDLVGCYLPLAKFFLAVGNSLQGNTQHVDEIIWLKARPHESDQSSRESGVDCHYLFTGKIGCCISYIPESEHIASRKLEWLDNKYSELKLVSRIPENPWSDSYHQSTIRVLDKGASSRHAEITLWKMESVSRSAVNCLVS